MRIVPALSVFAAAIVAAGTAFGDSRDARRAEVLAAFNAAERGELTLRDAARLQAHPLGGWLEVLVHERDLAGLSSARLSEVLEALGPQPAAHRLRQAWLRQAAAESRWADVLAHAGNEAAVDLRCAVLQARLATGAVDARWVEATTALWLSADSQPALCDPVFTAFAQRGELTPALRWQRIELAARAHNTGLMRAAARRHRVWLQPGSLPMAMGGLVVNRAPLIRPDGSLAFQDKWQMTRFERERWGVARGAPPQVFDTPWGRIGLSICYDAEFPKHLRVQVEAGAWLVLVPACTDTPAGATRVTMCARARAIENQCIVAVAPTVGVAPFSAALDTNHGRAGIYGPADRGFPDDGVLAEGAPDAPGWVFADIDAAMIAHVREHGGVLNHRDWPRGPLPPVRPADYT
ncbi:MAG TPA: hypothetical protein DCM32_06650 [Xanthomonadaceae bacterium]|nr:hypothetical protein [Xanthomonadaceae bacterium]